MFLGCDKSVVLHSCPRFKDRLVFKGVAYDSADTCKDIRAVLTLLNKCLRYEDHPECESYLPFVLRLTLVGLLRHLDKKAFELADL